MAKTKLITKKVDEVSELWSDDYEAAYQIIEKEINSLYRKTADVMNEFIVTQGFEGDISNVDEKVQFLKKKYKEASIPLVDTRTFKNWFDGNSYVIPEKEKIIGVAFAFNLSLSEAESFFKRMHIARGIDLHSINELPYYFCLKNNYTYAEAITIKNTLDKISLDEDSNGIYTKYIKKDIDELTTVQELIDYVKKNTASFKKNYIRARDFVSAMWDELTAEGAIIYQDNMSLNEACNFDKEILQERCNILNKRNASQRNSEKTDVLSKETIINTILGYDKDTQEKFKKNRNIKTVLNNSPIIHKFFAKNFPNRTAIGNILNGDKVEPDSIRKVLILLDFYRFWSNEDTLEKKGNYIKWEFQINDILSEAGLSELYFGNPYDAIFLFCNRMEKKDEKPLSVFRDFMLYVYECYSTTKG